MRDGLPRAILMPVRFLPEKLKMSQFPLVELI